MHRDRAFGKAWGKPVSFACHSPSSCGKLCVSVQPLIDAAPVMSLWVPRPFFLYRYEIPNREVSHVV